jgi:hypothetical protein
MDPDVAQAIPVLRDAGVLPDEPASTLLRIARGELLSVRLELKALLYAGVLTVVAGVGLLVKEHLTALGPVAVATAIGLAAAACLAWVVRAAPPFSWYAQPSPNLAFDYVLLLGVLLVGSDLAYIEVTLSPLGREWPFHLLVLALLYGALAVRYDSRVVLSLALSSFAAWRGVALSSFGTNAWATSSGDLVRANALGCGVIFLALGWAVLRGDRKPHFEPTASYTGWLLILGALVGGALEPAYRGKAWPVWGLTAIVVGVAVAILAARARRFPLFALGVAAAYVALSRFVVEPMHRDVAVLTWFTFSGAALLAGLIVAQRKLKETL